MRAQGIRGDEGRGNAAVYNAAQGVGYAPCYNNTSLAYVTAMQEIAHNRLEGDEREAERS